MKKLLALLAVGGLLALTTGCPPGSTSEEVRPMGPPPGGSGTMPPAGTTGAPHSGTTTPPAGTTTQPATDKSGTAEGKVTKSEGGKFTIKTDKGEKEFATPEDKDVKTSGKAGKAADIKEGADAKVTTDKEGKVTAVEVTPAAAVNPTPPTPTPASPPTEGKVTKIDGDKVTVKPTAGEAKEFTVPADATVTIDGKDKKTADLKDVKPDDKTTATVTEDKGKVTKIEIKTK